MRWSSISKDLGFILSLAGGITSFILGIFLTSWFSIFYLIGPLFVRVLQMIIIIGGVITIEGAILYWIKPSIAGKIVLVGSIVAGVNPVSLYGGIRIIKLKSES